MIEKMGAAMLLAAVPAIAVAQGRPAISKAEAAQLYTAAGFPIVRDQPTNSCGQRATPKVTFVDVNADKRPEALFIDINAKCYGKAGRYFAVLAKNAAGVWQSVINGQGTIRAEPTRTSGWFDMQVTEGACSRPWRFSGTRYQVAGACGTTIATAVAPVAPTPPAPPSAASTAPAKLSAADEAAAFKAASYSRVGKEWRSDCGDPGTASYSPGAVDLVRDLNGDGLPEAVLTEGGTYCYGNTGQGYSVVSKQPNGSWKLITGGIGIPSFLATKGIGGWPDIEIGGPGFCFPVERWNGKAYVLNRHQYEGKRCTPPN